MGGLGGEMRRCRRLPHRQGSVKCKFLIPDPKPMCALGMDGFPRMTWNPVARLQSGLFVLFFFKYSVFLSDGLCISTSHPDFFNRDHEKPYFSGWITLKENKLL